MSGPVGYRIEPGISKFTARAFAGGMLSAFGHSPTFAVRRFGGEATFDGEGEGSLELSIESGSLDLLDDVAERDRREILRTMHDEVLETARFPQISSCCSGIRAVRAQHRSGPVRRNAEWFAHAARGHPAAADRGPRGGGEETLRGYGEVAVKRSDYGVKDVAAAGNMIKVKDEVKVSFDIVARRQ